MAASQYEPYDVRAQANRERLRRISSNRDNRGQSSSSTAIHAHSHEDIRRNAVENSRQRQKGSKKKKRSLQMFDHLALETSLKKNTMNSQTMLVDDEKVPDLNGKRIESVEDVKDASKHVSLVRVKGSLVPSKESETSATNGGGGTGQSNDTVTINAMTGQPEKSKISTDFDSRVLSKEPPIPVTVLSGGGPSRTEYPPSRRYPDPRDISARHAWYRDSVHATMNDYMSRRRPAPPSRSGHPFPPASSASSSAQVMGHARHHHPHWHHHPSQARYNQAMRGYSRNYRPGPSSSSTSATAAAHYGGGVHPSNARPNRYRPHPSSAIPYSHHSHRRGHMTVERHPPYSTQKGFPDAYMYGQMAAYQAAMMAAQGGTNPMMAGQTMSNRIDPMNVPGHYTRGGLWYPNPHALSHGLTGGSSYATANLELAKNRERLQREMDAKQRAAAAKAAEDQSKKMAMILKQVEYLFSSANLANDDYMKGLMDDKEGWVKCRYLTKYARLNKLKANSSQIVAAVAQSKVLDLDNRRVRRKGDWKEYLPNLSDERLTQAELFLKAMALRIADRYAKQQALLSKMKGKSPPSSEKKSEEIDEKETPPKEVTNSEDVVDDEKESTEKNVDASKVVEDTNENDGAGDEENDDDGDDAVEENVNDDESEHGDADADGDGNEDGDDDDENEEEDDEDEDEDAGHDAIGHTDMEEIE